MCVFTFVLFEMFTIVSYFFFRFISSFVFSYKFFLLNFLTASLQGIIKDNIILFPMEMSTRVFLGREIEKKAYLAVCVGFYHCSIHHLHKSFFIRFNYSICFSVCTCFVCLSLSIRFTNLK